MKNRINKNERITTKTKKKNTQKKTHKRTEKNEVYNSSEKRMMIKNIMTISLV